MEKIYSIIIAMIVSFVSVTNGMTSLPKAADTKEEATAESSAATESTAPAESAAAQTKESSGYNGYGKILYVGDSRSVDMFSGDVSEILGQEIDGMTVYCKDGAAYKDMVPWIESYGIDNFDTLVTWMGCNNFGDFSQYEVYYDSLLEKGKTIVAGTVGPTVDECLLIDVDYLYYPNANQIKYNESLEAWANKRGVKIIPLYKYINNSSTVTVSETDGIHYFPQPTTELWNYIKENLK